MNVDEEECARGDPFAFSPHNTQARERGGCPGAHPAFSSWQASSTSPVGKIRVQTLFVFYLRITTDCILLLYG